MDRNEETIAFIYGLMGYIYVLFYFFYLNDNSKACILNTHSSCTSYKGV